VRRIATRNIPWEQCLVLLAATYRAVDGYKTQHDYKSDVPVPLTETNHFICTTVCNENRVKQLSAVAGLKFSRVSKVK
jgi:hypothetical protein